MYLKIGIDRIMKNEDLIYRTKLSLIPKIIILFIFIIFLVLFLLFLSINDILYIAFYFILAAIVIIQIYLFIEYPQLSIYDNYFESKIFKSFNKNRNKNGSKLYFDEIKRIYFKRTIFEDYMNIEIKNGKKITFMYWIDLKKLYEILNDRFKENLKIELSKN